jgi:hypothetical protein
VCSYVVAVCSGRACLSCVVVMVEVGWHREYRGIAEGWEGWAGGIDFVPLQGSHGDGGTGMRRCRRWEVVGGDEYDRKTQVRVGVGLRWMDAGGARVSELRSRAAMGAAGCRRRSAQRCPVAVGGWVEGGGGSTTPRQEGEMLAGDETLALSSPVPHATIITSPSRAPGVYLPAQSHVSLGPWEDWGRQQDTRRGMWDVGCHPVPALAAR